MQTLMGPATTLLLSDLDLGGVLASDVVMSV
jgi:hypothetical protein